jgi:AcrR family transcriptional regulator
METRERIVSALYEDVRLNGFQGLRADKVIVDLGITKGALYHYFPSKKDIGATIIDEILYPMFTEFYNRLDQTETDPIPVMQDHLRWLAGICDDKEAALGCPLNNLVQEMSPLDETFRLKLNKIVQHMQRSLTEALRRGQTAGALKLTFDCDTVAWFFLAGLEGSYSMAKVSKSGTVFKRSMQQLIHFLETLRQT